MPSLRDMTIKRKLRLIILLSASTSLLLCSLGFMANGILLVHSRVISALSILSQVIGSNTAAAVAFGDPKAAADVLRTLQAQPYITAACIYTNDGKPFASYFRTGAARRCPPSQSDKGHSYSFQSASVFRPIILDQQRIGVIYLRYDLGELYSAIEHYLEIALVVLAVSLVAAFLLGSKLQEMISGPVLAL